MTVMIDHAVYDGRDITVSFAIETDQTFGKDIQISTTNWFEVAGASGSGDSSQITQISDTRYIGLSTITPHFKDEKYLETLKVTWSLHAFLSLSIDLEVEEN